MDEVGAWLDQHFGLQFCVVDKLGWVNINGGLYEYNEDVLKSDVSTLPANVQVSKHLIKSKFISIYSYISIQISLYLFI